MYMHFTMPGVIRVEKFEFLHYIPADLLLKVVGHLNNIQSYIVWLDTAVLVSEIHVSYIYL